MLLEVIEQSKKSWAKSNKGHLRLQQSSRAAISQRNQTLVFYPFFKQMHRPRHLSSYNNDDLGIISGSGRTHGYATIDRHLRELTHLRLSKPLGYALAQSYWQKWHRGGSWADKHVFYLDAHEKILWSTKPGPLGFVSSSHQVSQCLKQFYIHGYSGHILYCETEPCDLHLSEHLLVLIDRFETAIAHAAVQVIVVDREGLSTEVILALLKAKKAIVTLLRANQYTDESDFERRGRSRRLKDPRTGIVTHRVVDADWWLTDEVKVRCGLLYPIDQPERLIVVVTTVNRHRAPDIRIPVGWYLHRWEVQENSFRALDAFVKINLNFGLNAKRKVPDRRVAAQIDQLSQHLKAVEHKIERKDEQYDQIQQRIDNQVARYENKLTTFHQRSLNARRQVNKDAMRQVQLADYQKRHQARLGKYLIQQLKLEDALEKHKEERSRVLTKLASLDPEAMFFEVDAEKDQIMTHLRIAAYNSALFAREHYFGTAYQHVRPITLWRLFFSQDGYYHESDDQVLITLKPFRDPKLHQAATEACRRFNERRIQLRSGKCLQMAVVDCK